MVWVVKTKNGLYDAKPGHSNTGETSVKCSARRFETYHEACERLAYFAPSYADRELPRIVRLKPRAHLSEAEIRKAERERIAAAVDEQGILITIAHRPVGQIAYLDNCTNGARGAQALKSAILAFDWKPGAP